MKKNLVQLLRHSGLSDKQAKVYMALLELGEGTVQDVARQAKIKRPTVYVILEELISRNLVRLTRAQKKTFLTAVEPKEILAKLKVDAEALERGLPEFEAVTHAASKRPKLVFFNGNEGFKKIWQMIFDSGVKEYLIITDAQEMLGFVRKGYITGRIIKEKIKRGIKSRQLIAFSEYAKEVVAKDAKENRQSKVLPHIYKITFTTIIFGDSVAFISPSGENLLLIFESKAFARSQASLFESLWSLLPD